MTRIAVTVLVAVVVSLSCLTFSSASAQAQEEPIIDEIPEAPMTRQDVAQHVVAEQSTPPPEPVSNEAAPDIDPSAAVEAVTQDTDSPVAEDSSAEQVIESISDYEEVGSQNDEAEPQGDDTDANPDDPAHIDPELTFDEWKERVESQEGAMDAPVIPFKDLSSETNFASVECGAQVVDSSKAVRGTTSILKPSQDDYMRVPCKTNAKIVFELCEEIMVQKIVLANYELFASQPSRIRVSVSERFPTTEWLSLGEIQLQPTRERQTFELPQESVFSKFVRLDLLDYSGDEYYCTLNTVEVFGATMMDEFQYLKKLSIDGEDSIRTPHKQPAGTQSQSEAMKQRGAKTGILERVWSSVASVGHTFWGKDVQEDDDDGDDGSIVVDPAVELTPTPMESLQRSNSDEASAQDSSAPHELDSAPGSPEYSAEADPTVKANEATREDAESTASHPPEHVEPTSSASVHDIPAQMLVNMERARILSHGADHQGLGEAQPLMQETRSHAHRQAVSAADSPLSRFLRSVARNGTCPLRLEKADVASTEQFGTCELPSEEQKPQRGAKAFVDDSKARVKPGATDQANGIKQKLGDYGQNANTGSEVGMPAPAAQLASTVFSTRPDLLLNSLHSAAADDNITVLFLNCTFWARSDEERSRLGCQSMNDIFGFLVLLHPGLANGSTSLDSLPFFHRMAGQFMCQDRHGDVALSASGNVDATPKPTEDCSVRMGEPVAGDSHVDSVAGFTDDRKLSAAGPPTAEPAPSAEPVASHNAAQGSAEPAHPDQEPSTNRASGEQPDLDVTEDNSAQAGQPGSGGTVNETVDAAESAQNVAEASHNENESGINQTAPAAESKPSKPVIATSDVGGEDEPSTAVTELHSMLSKVKEAMQLVLSNTASITQPSGAETTRSETTQLGSPEANTRDASQAAPAQNNHADLRSAVPSSRLPSSSSLSTAEDERTLADTADASHSTEKSPVLPPKVDIQQQPSQPSESHATNDTGINASAAQGPTMQREETNYTAAVPEASSDGRATGGQSANASTSTSPKQVPVKQPTSEDHVGDREAKVKPSGPSNEQPLPPAQPGSGAASGQPVKSPTKDGAGAKATTASTNGVDGKPATSSGTAQGKTGSAGASDKPQIRQPGADSVAHANGKPNGAAASSHHSSHPHGGAKPATKGSMFSQLHGSLSQLERNVSLTSVFLNKLSAKTISLSQMLTGNITNLIGRMEQIEQQVAVLEQQLAEQTAALSSTATALSNMTHALTELSAVATMSISTASQHTVLLLLTVLGLLVVALLVMMSHLQATVKQLQAAQQSYSPTAGPFDRPDAKDHPSIGDAPIGSSSNVRLRHGSDRDGSTAAAMVSHGARGTDLHSRSLLMTPSVSVSSLRMPSMLASQLGNNSSVTGRAADVANMTLYRRQSASSLGLDISSIASSQSMNGEDSAQDGGLTAVPSTMGSSPATTSLPDRENAAENLDSASVSTPSLYACATVEDRQDMCELLEGPVRIQGAAHVGEAQPSKTSKKKRRKQRQSRTNTELMQHGQLVEERGSTDNGSSSLTPNDKSPTLLRKQARQFLKRR